MAISTPGGVVHKSLNEKVPAFYTVKTLPLFSALTHLVSYYTFNKGSSCLERQYIILFVALFF